MPNDSALSPYFITGFVDAEGCFQMKMTKTKWKTGWKFELVFSIGLHRRDYLILERIQKYFGGIGNICYTGDMVHYSVGRKADLLIILNHFNTYPLITQKWSDFELFKRAYHFIHGGSFTRSSQDIAKLVSIKASLNLGLPEKIKAAFPDIIAVDRPVVLNNDILDGDWLAGFTAGEGCFFVHLRKPDAHSNYWRVELVYILTQHRRDSALLKKIIDYLDCGNFNCIPTSTVARLRCGKSKDIFEKIIPFFDRHKLENIKTLDYQDFCKVAEILKKKGPLTDSDISQIAKIKKGMNRGRYKK